MRQLKISHNITFRDSLSFEKYLKDVSKEHLLTEVEEGELAKRIQEGDDAALDKLVKCNLRFVISVAKQYQNQGVLLVDLVNEGNIGLLKAARRFDASKGFKFISYAVWWIRQTIQQCIYEHSRTIRIPINKIGSYQKITKFVIHYEQENNVMPSNDIICESLHISQEELDDYILSNNSVLSLDNTFNDEESKSFMEITKDNNTENVDEVLIKEQNKLDILQYISRLKEKEAEIIKMYYGLEDKTAMKLEDIGEAIDLTKERVRQIKEEGLRKLRKIMIAEMEK
jgi:RNA polymerase primary sigma factor